MANCHTECRNVAGCLHEKIDMGLVTGDEPKVNVFNKHMVGVRGDNIVIMIPPREMSKEDALILAAWLVALAEEEEGEFDKIRLQVSNL